VITNGVMEWDGRRIEFEGEDSDKWVVRVQRTKNGPSRVRFLRLKEPFNALAVAFWCLRRIEPEFKHIVIYPEGSR
jgi:hypothetical protein